MDTEEPWSVHEPAPSYKAKPRIKKNTQSENGCRVSEEEYWDNYYEHPYFNYEWDNGVLKEKPVSDFQGIQLYRWFLRLLTEYTESHQNGEIILLEMGFRLSLPHKVTIRKPDLAYALHENTPIALEDRSYHGTFDLCVESLSDSKPSEIHRDTIQKKAEYEGVGVKEYYILDANKKRKGGNYSAFYRLNSQGIYEEISPQNGVIFSEVLPNFAFRLDHLGFRPKPKQLLKDPIYQPYLLKDLQKSYQEVEVAEQKIKKARQDAKSAEQKIEKVRQEVEDAKQKAKKSEDEKQQLIAKLKAAGIDPDSL